MTVTKAFLFLIIIFYTHPLEAQNDSDTVSRIDYLNLNGHFIKYSYYYIDSIGAAYGLFNIQQCQVYTTRVIGKKVIVRNEVLVAYFYEKKYLELHYPDKIVYCKFKNGNFIQFLKKNTTNGVLVSRDKLVIDGKNPKIYCDIKMRSYKLIDQCE